MDLVWHVKSYIVGDQRCAACYKVETPLTKWSELDKLRTCGLFAWHEFKCAGRCGRVCAPRVCVVHLDTRKCSWCWRFAARLDDEYWERVTDEQQLDRWREKEDEQTIADFYDAYSSSSDSGRETSVASSHQQSS